MLLTWLKILVSVSEMNWRLDQSIGSDIIRGANAFQKSDTLPVKATHDTILDFRAFPFLLFIP